MSDFYDLETLALHAGHVPDKEHGSRAVPIHQTTSYVFKDARHAAAIYNLEEGGHLYSRISNPTGSRRVWAPGGSSPTNCRPRPVSPLPIRKPMTGLARAHFHWRAFR